MAAELVQHQPRQPPPTAEQHRKGREGGVDTAVGEEGRGKQTVTSEILTSRQPYSHSLSIAFRHLPPLNAFRHLPPLNAFWHLPPLNAFRHLPSNSARSGYATEGALFISAQLSTDAANALRKVCGRLWKQPSAQGRT